MVSGKLQDGDTTVPEPNAQGPTVGGGSRTSGRLYFLRSKKQRAVLAGVIVVIALSAYGYYRYSNRVVITPYVSSAQVTNQRITNLTQHPPASGASLQTKLAYYDNLVDAEATAKNYRAAIKDFNTRKDISTQGLDYLNFFLVATYYQQLGDKASALNALDEAEKFIPPDNPEKGFFQSDAHKAIDSLRQELSS